MIKLSRYEQETIINFNAGESIATVYTADKSVMRKFDSLVNEFPEVYKLIDETSYSRTYEMPKSFVSYRRPRKISEEQREQARKRIRLLNST